MDSDEEPLSLSSHALEALQQFKNEEKERNENFASLLDQSQKRFEKSQQQVSIDLFQEDWQLSQFWYTDKTAEILGRALLEGADADTVIVIASAPSVYAAIKKFPPENLPTEHIYILEYDERFKLLGGSNFSFYDYHKPNDIPNHLRNKCHRVLIDPPFLEEECQANSSIAAHNLLVKDTSERTMTGDLRYKLVTSTGERMKDVINVNYPDTHITDFYPEHKNGLSNEFRCYASFECSQWKFSKLEKDN